jgi:carotenoid cleavage dioxygenase-like enzyme
MKHLFDGYGMLVKMDISGGRVHVQQRCLSFMSTMQCLLRAP